MSARGRGRTGANSSRGGSSGRGRGGGSGRGRGGGSGRGRGGGHNVPSSSSSYPSRTEPNAGRGSYHSPGRGSGRGGGGGNNVPSSSSSSPYEEFPPLLQPVSSVSHKAERLSIGASSSSSQARPLVTSENSPQLVAVRPNTPQAITANPEGTVSEIEKRPLRPGIGIDGRKVIVKANHFLVTVADRELLCHYDVSILPEVASKKVCRDIINKFVECYKSHLGKRMLAYDGRKSCYTAGKLPFDSQEFNVKLVEGDNARRDREFKVSIKFASKADLHHLSEFLMGRQHDMPQEIIQSLDVVLRDKSSKSYQMVGRSFFHCELGQHIGELGNGLEYRKGFYQSLRPTQMGLSLNMDMSATAFFESIPVTEYVAKYLNTNSNRPLSDQDRIRISKCLRGVKVEVNHTCIRRYKILDLTTNAVDKVMFEDDSGFQISVADYFSRKHNKTLVYRNWPAIQAGNAAKPISLPMEVCKIVPGQRYSRRLNERQVTALLKATCQKPWERKESITDMLLQNNYNNDKLVNKEFGITVNSELTTIEARVLSPPVLKYHGTGQKSLVKPDGGQWRMEDRKMVDGGKVEKWSCISFSSSRPQQDVRGFVGNLINTCCSKGMEFNREPLSRIQYAPSNQIEKTLRDIGEKSGLQLLIIILPEISGSYGTIKRICETELDIVSQCCQPGQILKCMAKYYFKNQYMENMSLKINVKVGGRNSVLEQALDRRMPCLTDKPTTIIFGADVTHPQPGDDSSPSIAAVVASIDWPQVTKYRALVSAQGHRDEIIKDLGRMIREHMQSFRKSAGLEPKRIIFYRDGVSEGQFSQVLLYEVDAIRKACSYLSENYRPDITFIVVQKRHHTRLFPAQHEDPLNTNKRGNTNKSGNADKSGNILPGTVVDTKICHLTEFDFYLCSHAGIQGTSRPAHYHVLFDENNFTADEIQALTYHLCYTFARCTRSVSIVPPAYYAHLAAFRARYYVEGGLDSSDIESSSAPGGQTRDCNQELRPLPSIGENVKKVMFYC